MEGALDERKMLAQLGRLVFLPVLVNPKAIRVSTVESRVWQPRLKVRKCGHGTRPEQLRLSPLHPLLGIGCDSGPG
jgi:hypothetical protein